MVCLRMRKPHFFGMSSWVRNNKKHHWIFGHSSKDKELLTNVYCFKSWKLAVQSFSLNNSFPLQPHVWLNHDYGSIASPQISQPFCIFSSLNYSPTWISKHGDVPKKKCLLGDIIWRNVATATTWLLGFWLKDLPKKKRCVSWVKLSSFGYRHLSNWQNLWVFKWIPSLKLT